MFHAHDDPVNVFLLCHIERLAEVALFSNHLYQLFLPTDCTAKLTLAQNGHDKDKLISSDILKKEFTCY